VDDIARGTLAALKPLGYEIINLGGHEITTMNGLIRLIEKCLGKKARVERHAPNPADVSANQADVSKARRLLGWQPRVGLEDGIARLVDWYHAERSWAREMVQP
jgi:nucleoside-diphosphate-sugar epimerase